MSCAAFDCVILARGKDSILAITSRRFQQPLGVDKMGQHESVTRKKEQLIRFAVWAYAVGYALMAVSASFIASGSPFARLTLGDYLWPPLAVIALYVFGLARRLAQTMPTGLLACLALVPGLGAAVGSLVGLDSFLTGPWGITGIELARTQAFLAFFSVYFIFVVVIVLILVTQTFLAAREAPARSGANRQ